MENSIDYKSSGVNYDLMDPFKRACQIAARTTSTNVGSYIQPIESSRGESAFLFKYLTDTENGMYDTTFAHVQEGLGTKNLVADAMYALTGKSYYDHVAQDTVAMIVNDMITLRNLKSLR